MGPPAKAMFLATQEWGEGMAGDSVGTSLQGPGEREAKTAIPQDSFLTFPKQFVK